MKDKATINGFYVNWVKNSIMCACDVESVMFFHD